MHRFDKSLVPVSPIYRVNLDSGRLEREDTATLDEYFTDIPYCCASCWRHVPVVIDGLCESCVDMKESLTPSRQDVADTVVKAAVVLALALVAFVCLAWMQAVVR